MSIFSWFTDLFSSKSVSSSIADGISSSAGIDSFGINSLDDFAINPANGLPMVDGTGGVDVEGNPYGTDFSHDHLSSSGIDDSWSSSSSSSFDDTWSSGSSDGFLDW
ncbi:hypothetical protein [Simplicispira sedimenti]|uniref:hypothetical protein n=1 Tax=Simplicispira sedimenti TaxID=2919500 RepID=UPI001FA95AEE|nr:hypothetical protein [Acidovorax sp. W1-6]